MLGLYLLARAGRSLIIRRVKKPWISAGFAAAAVLALVPAAFGWNLAGIYVIRPLRIGFLLLALAFVAGSLESAERLHIRSHFLDHGLAYLRLLRIISLSATGALVLIGYVFFTTLGTWTHWPPTTDYYDRLSSALASGHLYVKEEPDPALIALSNPYDPDARKGISGLAAETPGSIWDMSVYRGRVYLYWGPAPALLLIPIKLVFPQVFGDQLLTFVFLFGAFIFESLILIHLWRRYFAVVPAWAVAASMLLLGFANPIPWLLFSPRIYEAAISAGQFFLVGGLYSALLALDREPVSRSRLSLAAILLVCAVGSRATLAVAVVYLALLMIGWLFWPRRRSWKTFFPQMVWFGAPVLLGALLLMCYNLARFGSPFEFGFRYAITMLDQNKYHNVLFSDTYVIPNMYLYLFNAPSLSSQFPFVKPIWNGDYVAKFNASAHAIYNAERIIGLLYVAPFFLLGLLAPAVALTSLRASAAVTPGTSDSSTDAFFRWFVLMLSGLALVELFVVFLVFYSTMRYFEDAAPTVALLSILGFWLVYQRLGLQRMWQVLYTVLSMIVMLFTIMMGILIGFSSDVTRLRVVNPALLTHLKLFFIALARRLGW